MQFWFFPIWSGDIRLEKSGETCVMTVEDPTAADRKILTPLLATALEMKWIETLPKVADKGTTTVLIDAPMELVGPLVADSIHADATTWTAVRYTDGSVTVSDGAQVPQGAQGGQNQDSIVVVDSLAALAPKEAVQLKAKDLIIEIKGGVHDEQLAELHKAEDKGKNRSTVNDAIDARLAATGKEPVAAVTVKEPRRGCPAPTACQRRASEVLRTFCTASQWRQWTTQGRLTVVGSTTGKSYHVYHRDEACRRQLSHSLVERGTGRAICVWDNSVPPEEEALGLKLAVEHREGWLRRLPRGPAAMN